MDIKFFHYMKNLLFVMLGGGAGSALRYLISQWLGKVGHFPLSTFLVNVLGSFAIGWLLTHFGNSQQALKLLLITGFCGGFTTFSTFSAENMQLVEDGQYSTFVLYALGSLVLGLAAAYLGASIPTRE